jgi:hypothetical protein
MPNQPLRGQESGFGRFEEKKEGKIDCVIHKIIKKIVVIMKYEYNKLAFEELQQNKSQKVQNKAKCIRYNYCCCKKCESRKSRLNFRL